MSRKDIPLDNAELLSVLLEGILYGFSLLMFGGTIWTLLSQRSTCHVNRKMLTVACLLLLFSTIHIVLDIIRLVEGFASYRDTNAGGSIEYFSNMSQWTFLCSNYVFTAQTLLADGVILYRCYVVWQSKLVMVLPALLWCAVGVTGIGSTYAASYTWQDDARLSQWITSFVVSALATNVLTTLLLVCRIWNVDRKATRIYGPGKSQLRPMLYIIIDAGVIYSLTLLVRLICFLCRSNFQYVLLYMVTPIISITFYMVIIRAGLANRAKQTTDTPLTSADISLSADPKLTRVQVHITTSTESKVENGHLSSTARINHENHQSEDKLDSVTEEVWVRARLSESLAGDADMSMSQASREQKRSSSVDIYDQGSQRFSRFCT